MFAVQEATALQRMVLHVAKQLVGEEVKEVGVSHCLRCLLLELVHLVRSSLLSSVVVTQLKLPTLKCSKIEDSKCIYVALDGIGTDG